MWGELAGPRTVVRGPAAPPWSTVADPAQQGETVVAPDLGIAVATDPTGLVALALP